MTTQEILRAVADARPELMEKTATIVALTERLHPDFVPGILQDFETICSVVNEKTAALSPELMKDIRRAGVAAGITVGGGLFSAIATDLYDAAKRGLSKGRNWERIMQANPNLKKEVDKRQLSMAFDALHRFAPDFTADPLIGGALLKQVSELPQMSHKTIIELIGAQKNIGDAKGRHFGELSKLRSVVVPEARERDWPGKGESAKQRPGE